MSLSFILTKNKKVKHYIKIKTHKLIVLRFWVESGVNVLSGIKSSFYQKLDKLLNYFLYHHVPKKLIYLLYTIGKIAGLTLYMYKYHSHACFLLFSPKYSPFPTFMPTFMAFNYEKSLKCSP